MSTEIVEHGLTLDSWFIFGIVLAPIAVLALMLICIFGCNCISRDEEEDMPLGQDTILTPIPLKRKNSVRFFGQAGPDKPIRQKTFETDV